MNWKAVIRLYRAKHYPNHVAEMEQFQKQPSLLQAIDRAALAQDADDKRFDHQRRLKQVTLNEAKEKLLEAEKRIGECRAFDDLLIQVEETLAGIRGQGKLYRYDSALRIGAWLGLSPDTVYLHAGTRDGAVKLGISGERRSVSKNELPEPLRSLSAAEIEDILCIFKGRIEA